MSTDSFAGSQPVNISRSCPYSEGQYLLPRTYELSSVFVSFSDDNLISTMIESIKRQKLSTEINIVVGQQDWEAAWSTLRPYSKQKNVHIIVAPSQESFWIQDYLEVGTRMRSGENFLMELPYWERGAEAMPVSIALWKKMSLVEGPKEFESDEVHGNGDYGGNIEALPGGIILVGDNMARSTKNYLRRTFPRQKILDITVSWLETGHVDELFSVVPTKKSSCGYVVAYASPKRALEVLSVAGADTPIAITRPQRASYRLYPFERCGLNGNLRRCKQLVQANLEYDRLIEEAKVKIKAELVKDCANVEFIPFPQVFHPAHKRKKYGTEEDAARALNTNNVNHILIGEDLIFAEQYNAKFREDVRAKVEALGLTPQPVDAELLHAYSGGIHCASLQGYTCQPVRKSF